MGSSLPVTSEVVIMTGKVGQANTTASYRVERKWQVHMSWKVRYLNLSMLRYLVTTGKQHYVTVWDDVGTADNQVLKCVTFAVVNVEFDCSATV